MFTRLFLLSLLLLPALALAAPDGAELYRTQCALCHGQTGQGVPGIFPPLAGSDFLKKEREKSLRAPLEGLAGKIEVSGKTYLGAMPPVLLDDEAMAAVFSHVLTSWGNQEPVPTRDEIAAQRAKTKFPTLASLQSAMGSGQLPAAPEGWTLSVGVELSFSPVRVVPRADGSVLILAQNGDIWSWKPGDSAAQPVVTGAEYIDSALGSPAVYGMTFDQLGRLYVVCNQRNEKVKPFRNEVTIFRSPPGTYGNKWPGLQPWLRTAYPWGVGPFNHGVSHIAQGPDGFLYVNSGSRTDGGEAGTSPDLATTGEDKITSSLWRVDPKSDKPELEVIARGLRNSFGFTWDSAGRLVATENGPDADAPEELNLIEAGHHYGFPYQFSDWEKKPYPHTPDTPAGLDITRPFKNTGPDAGAGTSTFDPHSCPSGIVWCAPDWPAPLGGSFLAVRYGNLLQRPVDVGFDVLLLRPDFAASTTSVKRLLHPLARPIDLALLGGHRIVIAEFCRTTTLAAGLGTPGRLLILAPAAGK